MRLYLSDEEELVDQGTTNAASMLPMKEDKELSTREQAHQVDE